MVTCPTCRKHFPDTQSACDVDGAGLLPDEAFSNVEKALPPGVAVGDYVIENKIGEGGMGQVYRGVHPLIGKAVAIKVLGRQYSSNPEMVARFIAEARAVNQIRHRHIIDIFSFGALADGRHYYVMELLEGRSLQAYVNERGRLSVGEAIAILRPIARALDAAHAAGIAHRDLKPENIFLSWGDEGECFPKLLDFGLVKLFGDKNASGPKTRTGMQMGTPYYMSPEQCRGVDVGMPSDVYSFGVMLFELVTGQKPFDAAVLMDLLMKHMQQPPPMPSSVAPDLPAALDAPIAKMLEKDPAARPASVGEALEQFTAAVKASGMPLSVAAPNTRAASDDAGAKTLPIGEHAGLAAEAVSATGPTGPMRAPPAAHAPRAAEPASPATQAAPAASEGAHARSLIGASSDTLVPTAARGGSRRWGRVTALVLTAASIATAGAALWLKRAPRSTATTQAETATTAAAAAPATASAPAAEVQVTAASTAAPPASATTEPSKTVRLTLTTTPAEVEVFEGAKLLGKSSAPIELPRGEKKVVLTLKARGFQSATVSVEPTEDREIKKSLDVVIPKELDY